MKIVHVIIYPLIGKTFSLVKEAVTKVIPAHFVPGELIDEPDDLHTLDDLDFHRDFFGDDCLP